MNDESKIWEPVKEYEGLYKVSSCGAIKSLTRRKWNGSGFQRISERILKQHYSNIGYMTVALWKDGKGKTHTVHRLVAKSFIDNPDNFGDINHIDGNKLNNNADNLEWCTRKHNINHAFEMGLSNNNHSKKMILNQITGIYYLGVKEAHMSLGGRYCIGYLRHMLSGVHPNKTNLIYV